MTMVRNSPAKAKRPQAPRKQNDKSRSAKAFRAGAALKAGGASYEEMRDALLQHEDPEIADWANSKGRDNNERELHASMTRRGRKGRS